MWIRPPTTIIKTVLSFILRLNPLLCQRINALGVRPQDTRSISTTFLPYNIVSLEHDGKHSQGRSIY